MQKNNSAISIIAVLREDQYLIAGKGSLDLEGQEINGFYFQQFQQIFYYKLTKEQKTGSDLKKFVKKLLNGNLEKFQELIDPDNDQLIFRSFGENDDLIASSSIFKWQLCNRVKVSFRKELFPIIKKNKTILYLKTNLHSPHQIKYDIYKKFQVRDVLVIEKLARYRYTGLLIGKTILKHYESLDVISLEPGLHHACPLFSFQFFYHEMQELYHKLGPQNFECEKVLDYYGIVPKHEKWIKKMYDVLRSESIDKLTQYTIFYITSNFFRADEHKKILTQYFHGKVGQLQSNNNIRMMSLMLNCLIKLPSSKAQSIYILENIEHIEQDYFQERFKVDQIVRIQIFSPTTDSLAKLNIDSMKKHLIYEIEPLTAKNVELYNSGLNGYNHIILPFNEYLIEEVKTQGNNQIIKLVQLSTPKNLYSNLIVWIGDNWEDARQLQEKINIKQKDMNYQIILLKNNKVYERWLIKYYAITVLRKVCIVFSGKDPDEGINTIELTRKYFGPDAWILMYTNAFSLEKQQYKVRMIDTQRIKFGKNYKSVLSFVNSCLNDQGQMEKDCSVCQCLIF